MAVIVGTYSQDSLLLDPATGVYRIGDVAGTGNGNMLDFDDANQFTRIRDTLGDMLLINRVLEAYELGDLSGIVTGSKIALNAINSTFEFTNGSGGGFFADGGAGQQLEVLLSNGLKVTGDTVLIHTGTALANGAGVASGTLLNAPAPGNPTKWISIDDNGTTRRIPAW